MGQGFVGEQNTVRYSGVSRDVNCGCFISEVLRQDQWRFDNYDRGNLRL